LIMLGAALLCGALALVGALHSQSGLGLGLITHAQPPSTDKCKAACEKIAESITSASQVFYPGEFMV
jgi:hypothetical protein